MTRRVGVDVGGTSIKAGYKLWLPMFLVAVMAFPVALVLSWIRAATIADSSTPGDIENAAQLGHLVAALGFIGFLAVFAAILFCDRTDPGPLQQERRRRTGNHFGKGIKTPKMPPTAKAFMGFMMMGIMAIGGAVVLHFVAAANVGTWSLEDIERWAINLEGVRRIGVAMYLFGILLGLVTIIRVLRFQAVRIRELAGV